RIIAGDFRNNGMGGILGAVYIAKVLHPQLFEDLNPRSVHQEYISRWMGLKYDLRKHGTFIYPPIVSGGEVIGTPSG
ncbi:MAG: ABC transporter substrate-binding protein, partial [Candidatus Korarchaeum sp.]|nr:ABC transporter substrate-binding protein [Candidatus Korarchaeum sp.]MDW8035058.1 ABC transporter substrate-binding protein [Candidatus Korarchaeum sp.]